MDITTYKNAFLGYLEQSVLNEPAYNSPENLYDPIKYILQLGGKRLRPALTLMSCEILSGDYKPALDAALAIEMFHNFTLMHDDIMDAASVRRGKTTVHKKWDVNTAILSGDAMMILAYRLFENYDGEVFKSIVSLFNKTAIEVCEGQQYDMDFETRKSVTLKEYEQMISLKTAVLIGAALKMGAIIARSGKQVEDEVYNFGYQLGMAFQLQDDYLDTFGSDDFGKRIGGDIIENKKTYLYIKTLEKASDFDKQFLLSLYNSGNDEPDKIQTVTGLFKKYGVNEEIQHMIRKYTEKAFLIVEQMNIDASAKKALVDFGTGLMSRKL